MHSFIPSTNIQCLSMNNKYSKPILGPLRNVRVRIFLSPLTVEGLHRRETASLQLPQTNDNRNNFKTKHYNG